jgi:hypothetical protein
VRIVDGRPLGYKSQFAQSLALFLLAHTILGTAALQAQDVLVAVDSIEGYPGFSIPVRVLIEIDSPIASVIVPLQYESDRLFPDSVTFHGTVTSPDHRCLATYSYDSNLVRVLALPDVVAPMPRMYDPGGLLATVWFSISPFAEEGFICIDTAYTLDSLCGDDGCLYFYPEELQASDLTGNQLYPDFTPGGIAIVPFEPKR